MDLRMAGMPSPQSVHVESVMFEIAESNPRGRRIRRTVAANAWLLAILVCQCASFADGPAAPSPAPSDDSIDWARARQFWSFRQPGLHPVTELIDPTWPRQPLDRLVLARLDEKGLGYSPEADKITLIRRATFDLTGLPPAPRDVEAFLADPRSDAYEMLIDRLLASSGYGQRMASMWLPLARYAEDQAHQVGGDTQYFYANAYKYRQWVIDAFNRDIPYDQFITFQLAADKVENGRDNLAALGFIGRPEILQPQPARCAGG